MALVSSLPASILIVRLGAIGDVTNALVLATAIKDAAPETSIGWASHPLVAPLVEGHPSVDRVHVWQRDRGLSGWRAVRDEVRAAGYEMALDLQRLFKSGLLARASRAPRVLGFDRGRTKEGSWMLTNERIPAGPKRAHMVDQYLEFARHLGIAHPVARHVLPPDLEAESWAEDQIRNWGSAPVILNLGASKPANRWPADRFGQLASLLADDLNAPVVLTGGSEDHDAAETVLACEGSRAINLTGATSLPQLIALLKHARLYIGCDTGPTHLAVAQGAPVLALFGPADPARTGPYGTRADILRNPPWEPGAQLPAAAMDALSVTAAFQAARNLDERYRVEPL